MHGVALIAALSLFGSVGFVLPMALGLGCVLLLLGQAVTALHWFGCLGVTTAVTLAIKATLAGSANFPYFPSGHVALAVAFFGGLGLLLSAPAMSRRGRLVLLAGIMAVAGGLVGVSRIAITDHDLLDVLGGMLVGAAPLLAPGPGVMRAQLGSGQRGAVAVAVLAFLPLGLLVHDLIDAPLREALRI